ncbi:MAG TPA: N-acetyl-gamma-glutamyl-phosphate reductase [Actinomycetota bacterium]|nr:N-acetyl-gamma-glutamyl-phosphate reductase [Actinomycetota bacterium]
MSKARSKPRSKARSKAGPNTKDADTASVAVLGSSGFAGGELLRILDGHPLVEVVCVGAFTQTGRQVGSLYPGLSPGLAEKSFVQNESAAEVDADLLVSSLPHTKSMQILSPARQSKVIDLGGDFRLNAPEQYRQWYGEEHFAPESLGDWVYGLTELNRDRISASARVANPGCYAAAALLCLAPLLAAGLIEGASMHVDAKSGVSGAGRAAGESFDFTAANENVRPYTPTLHKHIAEIEQELAMLAGSEVRVSFVPHLVPMTRGVSVTCVVEASSGITQEGLLDALSQRYATEPFVRVLDANDLPETRRMTGTNAAEVTARLDERTNKVIAFAALDNLGKGAAGQAVQNLNVMLGFEETLGLATAGLLP